MRAMRVRPAATRNQEADPAALRARTTCAGACDPGVHPRAIVVREPDRVEPDADEITIGG
jgi:hypothetical protein